MTHHFKFNGGNPKCFERHDGKTVCGVRPNEVPPPRRVDLQEQIARIIDGDAIEAWERSGGYGGRDVWFRADEAGRRAAEIMALVQPAPVPHEGQARSVGSDGVATTSTSEKGA